MVSIDLGFANLSLWKQGSLLLVAAGALSLYFGSIISGSKVERLSRLNFRILGGIFTVFYIILPVVLVYSLSLKRGLFFYSLPWWMVVGGLYLIYKLYKNEAAVKKNERLELTQKPEFRDALERGINEMRYGEFFNRVLSAQWKSVGEGAEYTFSLMRNLLENKKLIFLFALITSYLLLQGLQGEELLSLISLISSLLVFTLLAAAWGHSGVDYPHSVIEMEDGNVHSGRVLSYDEEFISIINENKTLALHKDKIKTIKQSIWSDERKNPADRGDSLAGSEGLHGSFNKVFRSDELYENAQRLKTNMGDWLRNEEFEEFRDKELDLGVVYKYSDPDSALDSDNLIKPIISALDRQDEEDDTFLVEDDSQIKRILMERQRVPGDGYQMEVKVDRDSHGNWRTAHGRVTVSFRQHDPEKPMDLSAVQEM